MPPPEGKAGDLCIWFITCFFFLLILSGGIFLVLYITQPETDETGWFPIVGMALIAIPWIFWILTCLYRTVMPCYNPPPTEAVAAPAESQVYSPGGGRRVRFGVATVIGTQDVADAVNGTTEGAAARNVDGSLLGIDGDKNNFIISKRHAKSPRRIIGSVPESIEMQNQGFRSSTFEAAFSKRMRDPSFSFHSRWEMREMRTHHLNWGP